MAVLAPWAWLILVVVLAAGCRTGPEQWGPFRGRIIDAETGRPIAGAHFMVSWERDNPNPVHWTQSFYDAQETVTDAEGRFEIPYERRFVTALVAEPRFRVFAAGYVAEDEDVTPPGGRSYVDLTVLKMRRLETLEERCRRRPGGPGMEASERVPIFRKAVQDYRSALACSAG